jgi:hypothetical protein
MRDLEIFPVVASAVQAEVNAANAALREWPDHAPTPLLLGLCEVLEKQVASLRPVA